MANVKARVGFETVISTLPDDLRSHGLFAAAI